MEKEVDGDKVRYYYEGSLLLCEKDGAGKMQKVYVNDGEGIVGMIRYIYKNTEEFSHYQRLYYLYDSLGSVSVVAGENGLPLQNYTYSPYGSCLNTENDPVNNLRFVGRYGGYKDNDTNLTYFWHRWYDERDGRWVSRDMIGVCDDLNLYRYVKNNTKNYIDETGNLIYGNYCGKWWTGGRFTLFGILKPNWDVEPIDDLDSCCKQHDKDWNDCEQRYKCSPNKDVKINECKKQKNKDFCSCLKTVNAVAGTYKSIYIKFAKDLFKCR